MNKPDFFCSQSFISAKRQFSFDIVVFVNKKYLGFFPNSITFVALFSNDYFQWKIKITNLLTTN